MSASALRQSQETRWTVMSGPLKGTVHNVGNPNLVIGRSQECDLVIVNDPKCSRKHARVDWTDEGYVIQSLSGSNVLKVNGNSVDRSVLNNNDLVCFGDTEMLFNSENASGTAARSQVSRRALPPPMPAPLELVPPPIGSEGIIVSRPPQGPPVRRKPKRKSANGRILLYGSIVLVIAYFANNEVAKRKVQKIRSSEQSEADIKEAMKLQQTADAERVKKVGTSTEIRQAQENYVKGFRDYKKGQYERAVESFQACLSLFPDHILCNRYLRLSQKKFDELIEAEMILGRKYRDQALYRECLNAFQNVMYMVKDFNNPRYKEGKANFDACNAFVEGRF